MNAKRSNQQPHTHAKGVWGWVLAVLHLDGHSHGEKAATDPAISTQEGIRVIWLALAALGITTILQIVIVWLSGSVALLGDTVHNLGDTLNSIPLLIAFYLARRVATRRYTYGFGKAEDVAGVLIVLSIFVSAGVVFWESVQKLISPQPMQHIPWVALAAVIGFLGNEAVAVLQIRTGRRIGSDAMVADGLHARIDGFTSLAVLVAAIGTWLGFPIVDPLIGLLIGVAILAIAKDATIAIWYRLMDGVDPVITDQIEQYAGDVKDVVSVGAVRARWVGHTLQAEVELTLSNGLTQSQSVAVTQAVRQLLLANVPYLTHVVVDVGGEIDHSPATVATSSILPPRYQDPNKQVSAAPMGAAALKYDQNGKAAWDEIWTGYCELALAGGPPHRGSLLEPIDPESIAAKPEQYQQVINEISRGLKMVTGLPVHQHETPGWIDLECKSEEMAVWLLRAITVENVAVRREGNLLYLPAGPDFRLEREIKNVVTVVAKTFHYWTEHAQSLETIS